MTKWRMCPRCGVKMQHTVDEDEVDIFKCPICKDGELTISGELLKKVEKIAGIKGESVNDILLNALQQIKDWRKNNESLVS